MKNNLQMTLVLEQVLDIKGMGLPQCLLLRDTWWIGLMALRKIKEISMICVTNFQNIDNRFQSMDSRFQTLDKQIEAV